jgi:hypothetical protein
VVENLEVLRQNGFDVSITQDESSDEARLALSAQPISKDKVFDFKGTSLSMGTRCCVATNLIGLYPLLQIWRSFYI